MKTITSHYKHLNSMKKSPFFLTDVITSTWLNIWNKWFQENCMSEHLQTFFSHRQQTFQMLHNTALTPIFLTLFSNLSPKELAKDRLFQTWKGHIYFTSHITSLKIRYLQHTQKVPHYTQVRKEQNTFFAGPKQTMDPRLRTDCQILSIVISWTLD